MLTMSDIQSPFHHLAVNTGVSLTKLSGASHEILRAKTGQNLIQDIPVNKRVTSEGKQRAMRGICDRFTIKIPKSQSRYGKRLKSRRSRFVTRKAREPPTPACQKYMLNIYSISPGSTLRAALSNSKAAAGRVRRREAGAAAIQHARNTT